MNLTETLLTTLLDDSSAKIKSGNCKMSEEDMMDLIDTMVQHDTTQIVSKEQACHILNMSRSKFDEKVRCGLIPRGRKIPGFTELVWTKQQLHLAEKEMYRYEHLGEEQ